jgi:hypothetical protein
MNDRRFTVTIFPDERAFSLTTEEVTLNELRDVILTTTADRKADLPLIKMATFGTERTKKNSLRHDANVETITGIEVDYDGEIVPFDQAVAAIRQSRLNALGYTSPRNTAATPRWRLLLPTSQSLPPEERYKLVSRVNGILNGILATESFTLSQSFYLGHINGNADFRVELIDGDFIDVRADLDATARGKTTGTGNARARGTDDIRDFNIEEIAADDPRLSRLGAQWIQLGTKGTGPRGIDTKYKGDRSDAVFGFTCECVRQGIADDLIASCFVYWKIGEHIREQPDVKRVMNRTIARAHAFVADSKLFAMNEKHCVLPLGGKTRVVTLDDDPEFPGHKTITMTSSLADFKAPFDKYRHTYQSGGQDHVVPLGTWWVKNPGRRQDDGGMKFVPICDADIIDGNTMNLWQGFKVAARKPAGKSGAKGCSLLFDHGLKIICSGNEEHYDYLIKREAFIAQRRTRTEISVGLQTEAEGTGKGLWSRAMNHLYGIYAMEIQNPDHVVGKHNPHLEKLLRLTADEALFALNPLHRNALYNLITEPRITIEPKFVNAYPADNYLNIDVISNADHFIPVSGFARRFFVPTVSQEKANDHDYFRAILKQLHDGGYEALLYHLLHEVDIRDFNVRAVPRTAALLEQAAHSRKGVDLLVEQACNEARVPCQHDDFPGFSVGKGYERREGFDYFIDHHSDHVLNHMKSLKVKRQLVKHWGCMTGEAARTQRGGCRDRGVLWPPLADLRAKFEAKYGPQHWMTDAEEWEGDGM